MLNNLEKYLFGSLLVITVVPINNDLLDPNYHVIMFKDDVYHIPTFIHKATESKVCH